MFSIVEFINAVFCCVDDLLKDITLDRAIRPHGVLPTLAESEVITTKIVAEYGSIV